MEEPSIQDSGKRGDERRKQQVLVVDAVSATRVLKRDVYKRDGSLF